MNDDRLLSILAMITDELRAAERLHPEWPPDVIHGAAIVAEESGELVQAALQHVYDGKPIGVLRREAVQTAAMCVRFLLNTQAMSKP